MANGNLLNATFHEKAMLVPRKFMMCWNSMKWLDWIINSMSILDDATAPNTASKTSKSQIILKGE